MAVRSLDALADRLDRLNKNFESGVRFAVRGAGKVAALDLVLGTPVLTGHARDGWDATVDSDEVGAEKPLDSVDPVGSETFERLRFKIDLYSRLTDTLVIQNPVSYIAELDRGSSAKAPQGFSRAATLRAIDFLKRFRYLKARRGN